MDAGASGGGYEHAYASQAVYSKDIAAMSREERQKIIQDYQNAVTPADKAGLLSTTTDGTVAPGGPSGAGDPKWSTTNGNIMVSAQKNAAKIGGLFKRKSSASKAQPDSQVKSEQAPLERSVSNKSNSGFQKLADE